MTCSTALDFLVSQHAHWNAPSRPLSASAPASTSLRCHVQTGRGLQKGSAFRSRHSNAMTSRMRLARLAEVDPAMLRVCGVNWSQATTGAGGAIATALPSLSFLGSLVAGRIAGRGGGMRPPSTPHQAMQPEDLTPNNTPWDSFRFQEIHPGESPLRRDRRFEFTFTFPDGRRGEPLEDSVNSTLEQ
jgi:hypothetical protein